MKRYVVSLEALLPVRGSSFSSLIIFRLAPFELSPSVVTRRKKKKEEEKREDLNEKR